MRNIAMKNIAALALAGFVSAVAAAEAPDVKQEASAVQEPSPVAQEPSPAVQELTAAQIVEKNVAARGGLDAWRKIQTMVWIGHIERPNTDAPSLPYVLEQKRPNKTHFEIKAQNQTWVRIFDGTHGWKLRPGRNGAPEVAQYSTEELKSALNGQGIDGPLMDHQAKGIAVALEGVDEVEGRKAYRLNVKLPSGAGNHVWVDAQTFLEVKYDRQSRKSNGQLGTVSVHYRDYGMIEGVQMPRVIETGSDMARAIDKMVIDRIMVNPPLNDRTFARPNVPERSMAATSNTAGPQVVQRPQTMSSRFPRVNLRSVQGAEAH